MAAGVLAEHGPMGEEQLISALADHGVALGDDADLALTEALDARDGLPTVLANGRWASLPALLTGRAFTHRLTRARCWTHSGHRDNPGAMNPDRPRDALDVW